MFDSCIRCIQSTFVTVCWRNYLQVADFRVEIERKKKVRQSEDLYICTMRDFYDYTAISLFIRQEIKHKFGEPSIVMSDYGQEFISKKFQAYLNSNKIKHPMSNPYHA